MITWWRQGVSKKSPLRRCTANVIHATLNPLILIEAGQANLTDHNEHLLNLLARLRANCLIYSLECGKSTGLAKHKATLCKLISSQRLCSSRTNHVESASSIELNFKRSAEILYVPKMAWHYTNTPPEYYHEIELWDERICKTELLAVQSSNIGCKAPISFSMFWIKQFTDPIVVQDACPGYSCQNRWRNLQILQILETTVLNTKYHR